MAENSTNLAEERLEPLLLVQQSGVIVRAGGALLSAGCGSYRVKIAMKQIANALGLDSIQAQVTVNEIIVTCHKGPIFRTEVSQTNTIGVNADRINKLERYCATLKPGTTVEEVNAKLDEIESTPLLYGYTLNALFSALACAGFAFLNNGGPVEIVAVFFGAGLGQLARRTLLHRHFNQLAVTMFAAAVACAVYLGFAHLMFETGIVDSVHEAGYVFSVLFLVPGFPLITAGLDLSRLDFSAGMSRLTYAVLILISAALSVWAISALFQLDPTVLAPPEMDWWADLLLTALASAFSVLGFAFIFNSTWQVTLAAIFIGTIANVIRFQVIDAGMFPLAAAGLAGLIVGVMANIIAPRMAVSRITVSVPAVVIMIPGSAGYRAIYYLNSGSTLEAITWGVEAVFVVIALIIGMTVSRSVTDRTWLKLPQLRTLAESKQR